MRLIPVFVLFAFFVMLPTHYSFAATAPVGTVKRVMGHVVAVRGTKEVTLKLGDPVYEGDLLKTGPRSSIFTAMKGDKSNSIRLGQKSQLEIQKYKVTPTEVLGGFLKGLVGIFSVELNNLRRGSEFSMHTPTAVLGVRGTIWGAVVKSDGSTTFAVKRGSVSVTMGGRKVTLEKGQSVSISKAGQVKIEATPKALQDALDSDGDSFDNSAAEAAALAAADAAAIEATKALAEAAEKAMLADEAATKAAAYAAANPDDKDAAKLAAELAIAAEAATQHLVAAAKSSQQAIAVQTMVTTMLNSATQGLSVYEAPVVSSNTTTTSSPSTTDSTTQTTTTTNTTTTTTSTPTGGGLPASPA